MKLYAPINGRRQLRPELLSGYFKIVLFIAMPVVVVSYLQRSLAKATGVIQGALERMDDKYLRSAANYLQQVWSNIDMAMVWGEMFGSPNLRITTWDGMPIHDADFG